MNKIIAILLFISILSCGCPECETYPEPLRIIFTNSTGDNTLANGELDVLSITNNSGIKIEFAKKNFVIKNSNEKMHIEILSEEFYDQLINSQATFYMELQDNSMDTLIYGITEIEGKCCRTYKDKIFNYNGKELTGLQENTIGAYVVVAE